MSIESLFGYKCSFFRSSNWTNGYRFLIKNSFSFFINWVQNTIVYLPTLFMIESTKLLHIFDTVWPKQFTTSSCVSSLSIIFINETVLAELLLATTERKYLGKRNHLHHHHHHHHHHHDLLHYMPHLRL